MLRIKSLALAGLMAAISAAPASAGVVWTHWVTISDCGGSNFATCLTADLYYSGSTLGVQVTNDGGPGIFTRVGVVNVQDPTVVSEGTSVGPNGAWGWETDNGLSGDGLPETIWAWSAPPSPIQNGIAPGESGWFTFQFDPSIDMSTVGIAIHAQGGPNGCSTKFGIWNIVDGDNYDTNDAGPDGYDGNCVSVPEPGTMSLLAAGAMGMALIARRRRNGAEIVDEDGNDIEA